MLPTIIHKSTMRVAGLTGDGARTGLVWEDFERRYAASPFAKADEQAYEIRLYGGSRAIESGMDIHVGFAAAVGADTGGFAVFELPAGEYAVFDVRVADGYDSGNAAMDKWLADNAVEYSEREADGRLFVVECYNEKFKGGGEPDSVVEIWVPIIKTSGGRYEHKI